MKLTLLIISFISFVINFSVLVESSEENVIGEEDYGKVLKLTRENLEKAVEKYTFLVVLLYSRRCVPCLLFYDDIPRNITDVTVTIRNEKLPGPKRAEIDVTDEIDLWEGKPLNDYPLIHIYIRGERNGQFRRRVAEKMEEWAFRRPSSLVSMFLTLNELSYFVKSHELAVVGFFQIDHNETMKEFYLAAKAVREYHFGIVTDESIASDLGINGDAVVVFRKMDLYRATLSRNLTSENIAKFVKSEADVYANDCLKDELSRFEENKNDAIIVPTKNENTNVMTLSDDNFYEVVYEGETSVLVNFRFFQGGCDRTCQVFEQLGEEYRDDRSIVIAQFDCARKDLIHCGGAQSFSQIKLFKKEKVSKTEVKQFEGEITVEALVEFLDDRNTDFEQFLAQLIAFSVIIVCLFSYIWLSVKAIDKLSKGLLFVFALNAFALIYILASHSGKASGI